MLKVQLLLNFRPKAIVGAFGETKDADEHVKKVLELVRKDLEEKEGKQFETFEAISFSTQTVAGRNYLIKVRIREFEEFVETATS